MAAVACVAVLGVGACGDDEDDDASSGSDPTLFTPPQPLSREQFRAIGIVAGPPGDVDPTVAENLFEGLCRGDPTGVMVGSMLAFPNQAAGFQQVLDEVERQCGVPAASLDRARGQIARSMASNQAAIDHLTGADVSGFCRVLQDNDDITSTAIGEAAEGLGVVPEGAGDLVELGISVLIESCPELLDRIQG